MRDYLDLARGLIPDHDLRRMTAAEIISAIKDTDWYKNGFKFVEGKPLTHNEYRALFGMWPK